MGNEIWMLEKLKNENFERNAHSKQKVFFSQFRHQTWSKVIFASIRKPTLFCKYFWFTRTFILLSISSTSDRVRMTNRRHSIGGHNAVLFFAKNCWFSFSSFIHMTGAYKAFCNVPKIRLWPRLLINWLNPFFYLIVSDSCFIFSTALLRHSGNAFRLFIRILLVDNLGRFRLWINIFQLDWFSRELENWNKIIWGWMIAPDQKIIWGL